MTAPEAQEAGYACLGRNCAAKIAIAHPRPEVPKRKENGEVIEDPEGRIVYSCYGSPHTEANREFGRLFWGKLAGMVEEGVFVVRYSFNLDQCFGFHRYFFLLFFVAQSS